MTQKSFNTAVEIRKKIEELRDSQAELQALQIGDDADSATVTIDIRDDTQRSIVTRTVYLLYTVRVVNTVVKLIDRDIEELEEQFKNL